MGSEEDMGYYRPGIAEFDSPLIQLPAVMDPVKMNTFLELVRFYVHHPHVREAIGARGRKLFEARRMSGL